MDPLFIVLSQLGLGLAVNGIYDLIKSQASEPLDQKAFITQLQNRIDLNGVNMRAETVISALTRDGFLSIQGSHLYARDGLVFGSQSGAAIAGNDSILETSKTSIVAGKGASIQTEGNAQIRQNQDGSITFHTGSDGGIGFHSG